MLCPQVPDREHARLQRLRALDLLDGPAESAIDAFTRVATRMTGMPIGLVSLVDHDRQWFKSAVGCIPQGSQTPREVSFCGHAILQPALFEVEDARLDPRFRNNPLVTGHPRVVHYAGAPLALPGGEHIGTLCVIGHAPGRLDERGRELLGELAGMLTSHLLLRERERAACRNAITEVFAAVPVRPPHAVRRAVRHVDALRRQLQQELAA